MLALFQRSMHHHFCLLSIKSANVRTLSHTFIYDSITNNLPLFAFSYIVLLALLLLLHIAIKLLCFFLQPLHDLFSDVAGRLVLFYPLLWFQLLNVFATDPVCSEFLVVDVDLIQLEPRAHILVWPLTHTLRNVLIQLLNSCLMHYCCCECFLVYC